MSQGGTPGLTTTVVVALSSLALYGWWAFDGVHAMVTGDLVTPKSGAYAGQYGPWSKVVDAIGLNSHARAMHVAFLVLGLMGLAITAMWIGHVPYARWALVAFAIASIWYLPFGTVLGLLIAALVAWRG